MLLIACLVRMSARSSLAAALAASVLSGLAVATRPAALPLIGIVLLAILLRANGQDVRRTAMLMLACVAAWAAVAGGERLYAAARHGLALT